MLVACRRGAIALRYHRLLSSAKREYEYFDNFEMKDGIGIIRLNGPGAVNTISPKMQDDVDKIFDDHVVGNKDLKGLVFISSKKDNFIAGADIDMIKNTENKADLKEICMKGHRWWKDIKQKTNNMPFVAAINGSTLGGGLEWAMYCDYRIATTSPKTILGLPEVKLGLLPGLGGTYHLPKLVGYQEALGMILQGKDVRSDKAKKIGLVDMVVDQPSLESVAIDCANQLAAGTLKKKTRKASMMSWALEENPIGRGVMFSQAKKMVDKNTGGKYPAPYAILDLLSNSAGKSKEEHLENEANEFVKLASTPESAALIGIFQGMSEVKKHDYGKPKRSVKNIGVLGAGLMGSGIAEVSLNGGYRVYLKDKDAESVGRGQSAILKSFQTKLKKKRMTNHKFCETSSRLVPLHDNSSSWKKHFSNADMVIEAVFEDIKVKHQVIQNMESIVSDDCVIATNTSAIPITRIAEGARLPERVIGMHYFSPVPKMPLLEIITHDKTAAEVAASAMEVGTKQKKNAIFVKDVPGFYVNRCLAPFSAEAGALISEGCNIELMDKAMTKFGMPVGPITLCDEVGIDVSAKVGRFMTDADLGHRMDGGNLEVFEKMCEANMMGRKSGKGFYMYPKDAKKGAKKQINPEMLKILKESVSNANSVNMDENEIQRRLIAKFINEAAYCLQDGIIRAPADGDIGAVMGIGFPPFLGGPFRMLDSTGTQNMVDTMYKFRDAHGERFEPCQLLKDYASSGKKFYN